MQGFNILVNGQIEMEVLICSQKTIKKQQSQKMEPKHQRFTIKKFSVGVASVLIGTTFAVHRTNSVLADQTNTEPGTEMVETAAEDPGDTLAATEEANNENGAPVEDATTNETPQAETPMTEVPVPTVTPEADCLHTGWSPELAETVTDAANYVAQYKIKDNVQYVVEGGTINKAFGDPTTADEVIGAVITGYPADQTPQPTITVDDPSKLPNGTEAGEFDIPVTVTYPDGSTGNGTVKVTVLDKIIDRTNDPDAPTPAGYVRVTFDAGANGKFADGASYIFDVREGTPASEVTVPTIEPAEGYVQDGWAPVLPDTFTTGGTFVAQYKVAATDADKYDPTGKDITTPVGSTPAAEDGIGNVPELPPGTKIRMEDSSRYNDTR